MLRILGDGPLSLVPRGIVSSGGIRPDSIAVHGRLVYVANSGNGGSNYTGFQLPQWPPRRPSSSGSSLITASSSPAKIPRPSLMLATGITFSVHPSAL